MRGGARVAIAVGIGATSAFATLEAITQDTARAQPAAEGGAPRCTIEMSGALEATRACAPRSKHEAEVLDGGMSSVSFLTAGSDPGAAILFRIEGPPMAGRVPDAVLSARMFASFGGVKWIALASPRATPRGSIQIVLTSARAVKVGGHDHYELHGEIEASLVPDSYDAVGRVELRTVF